MLFILNVCILIQGAVLAEHITYKEVKDIPLERPKLNTVMGTFLNYPGLTYEPQIPDDEGLIYFDRLLDGPRRYSDRLSNVQEKYNVFNENLHDCGMFTGYKPPQEWNSTCLISEPETHHACTRASMYGYEDGTPCVVVSLERILNWLPEPYTDETVPDKIRDKWNEYYITIDCEGEDPVTRDNLGKINYFPAQGIHVRYFPYTGQKHWLNPYVFVQLEHLSIGVALRVTCKAFAKNIKHYGTLNTGQVSFELMLD